MNVVAQTRCVAWQVRQHSRSAGGSDDTSTKACRRRRRGGWILLAVGVGVATFGTVIGHGAIMALGLLLVAVAMYAIDPYRRR